MFAQVVDLNQTRQNLTAIKKLKQELCEEAIEDDIVLRAMGEAQRDEFRIFLFGAYVLGRVNQPARLNLPATERLVAT